MSICRYSLFELVVVTEPPVIRNKFVEVKGAATSRGGFACTTACQRGDAAERPRASLAVA